LIPLVAGWVAAEVGVDAGAGTGFGAATGAVDGVGAVAGGVAASTFLSGAWVASIEPKLIELAKIQINLIKRAKK
jgi:hypothetical protein